LPEIAEYACEQVSWRIWPVRSGAKIVRVRVGVAEDIEWHVIRLGETFVTADGEDLATLFGRPHGFEDAPSDARELALESPEADEVGIAQREAGYVSLSRGARQWYVARLTGAEAPLVRDVAMEVLLAEGRRAYRHLLWPWTSIDEVRSSLARCLALAERAGASGDVLDELRSYLRDVEALQANAIEGDRVVDPLVRALIRPEVEASDCQVGGRRAWPVVGLYNSEVWVRRLPRSRLVGLAQYWDSKKPTRHIEHEYGGGFACMKLGERVRLMAAHLVGVESVSRDEFVEWCGP